MFNTGYETALAFASLVGVACVTWKYLFRKITRLNGDNVVVITGASSGIGYSCALEFYRLGCQVVLCSRDALKLEAVKRELVSEKAAFNKHEPLVVPVDISDESSIQKAVAEINDQFPDGIHILINNAGITYRGEICSTSMDVFRHVMEVNFFGQVAFTKLLLPSLTKVKKSDAKSKTKAHILCVNSVQGKISLPFRSCYEASKFACSAFYDCLRSEVAELGIKVYSVHPGYVRTNISLNAVTAEGGTHGKMDSSTASGMEPRDVALGIIQAIECNNQEVLLLNNFIQRLAIWIRFFSPSLYFWIMSRRAKHERSKNK